MSVQDVFDFLGRWFAGCSTPQEPTDYFGSCFLDPFAQLNMGEAQSVVNSRLGIPDSRVDAKVLFADSLSNGLSSLVYAISGEGAVVQSEVLVCAVADVPDTRSLLRERVESAGLQGVVTVKGASAVMCKIGQTDPSYVTATAMSFGITAADGCEVPVTLLQPVAVSSNVVSANAQLARAAQVFGADDAQQAGVRPGEPLPSGTPLPAAPASPYTDRVNEFGPRPDTTGLTSPCDIAVATSLQCVWDANCDALRALQVSKRKIVTGGVGIVGVIAGIAVACVPGVNIGVIVIGVIAAGASGVASYDAGEDAKAANQDSEAALNRRDECYKRAVAAIEGGACD